MTTRPNLDRSDCYTAEEVAIAISVPIETVHKWRRTHRLPELPGCPGMFDGGAVADFVAENVALVAAHQRRPS